MEFNLEVAQDILFIRSLGEQGIRIGDDYYNRPFILSGQQLISEWNVSSAEDIDRSSLKPVFNLQPELVLLGTGKTQVFLPAPIQALFFERGIGFEVMTTDAACRTFNILITEGRRVVAALLPPTS